MWACTTHDGCGVGKTPGERVTSHGGEDIGDVAHENGLGFQFAERIVPAAFWASWADALPMNANLLSLVPAHVVGAATNEGLLA